MNKSTLHRSMALLAMASVAVGTSFNGRLPTQYPRGAFSGKTGDVDALDAAQNKRNRKNAKRAELLAKGKIK